MLRAIFGFACLLLSIQGATVPRPLADIAVPIEGGKKLRLNQYRGKVMLVALISTTCDSNSRALLTDPDCNRVLAKSIIAVTVAG